MKSHKLAFLLIILGITVFLALGFWQLNRKEQKNNLIQNIIYNSSLPPILLDEHKGLLDALCYRRVILKGYYLYDKEIFIYSPRNNQNGYLVVTPIKSTIGKVFMVSREWRPVRDIAPNTYNKSLVTVTGYMMPGEGKKWFYPSCEYTKRLCFYFNLEEIQQFLEQQKIENFYLTSIADNDIELLIRNLNIKNNHLGYAITWFSFAFILVTIYINLLYQWRKNGTNN